MSGCPDLGRLSAYAARSLPSGEREEFEDHLSWCAPCRRSTADLLTALEPRERGSRILAGILSWKRGSWGVASGVAAVLLTAVSAGFLAAGRPNPVPPFASTLPAGDRIVQAGEYASHGASGRFLILPDGSRLKLEPGASIRMDRNEPGERVRLFLRSGVLEADVAPGRGMFRIAAPAGEVRVMGTRFRLSSFSLKTGFPASGPFSCLCVEVQDGKVALSVPSGTLPVSAGERGAVVEGQVPEKLETGLGSRALLRSLARHLETGPDGPRIATDRPQARLIAAFLLGTKWPDPAGSEEAERDSDEIRQVKKALRDLKP